MGNNDEQPSTCAPCRRPSGAFAFESAKYTAIVLVNSAVMTTLAYFGFVPVAAAFVESAIVGFMMGVWETVLES